MEKRERVREQGSVFSLSSLQYYLVYAQYRLLYEKKSIIQSKQKRRRRGWVHSSSFVWSSLKQCLYLYSCRFP